MNGHTQIESIQTEETKEMSKSYNEIEKQNLCENVEDSQDDDKDIEIGVSQDINQVEYLKQNPIAPVIIPENFEANNANKLPQTINMSRTNNGSVTKKEQQKASQESQKKQYQPQLIPERNVVNGVSQKSENPNLAKKQEEKTQTKPITIKIFEEKINRSIQLKNQGNVFFKNKDYIKSSEKYQEALKILDPNQFYGATHEECLKMAEVSSQLLNNIGTCHFNSMDWKRAQIFYSEAITINPKYTKALLKRALCRYELGNHFQALQDIKRAYFIDKSNQQIHQAYEKILASYKIAAAQQREKQKALSSKMFKSQMQREQQLKEQRQKKKALEQQQKQKNKQEIEVSNSWDWVGATIGMGLLAFTAYKIFSK